MDEKVNPSVCSKCRAVKVSAEGYFESSVGDHGERTCPGLPKEQVLT